jgi:hypothetical protein
MLLKTIALTAFLAIAASASVAQEGTSVPDAATKAQDCARARHDHGADRGTPSSKSGCKTTARKHASEKAGAKGSVQGHDHGKVHKNQ